MTVFEEQEEPVTRKHDAERGMAISRVYEWNSDGGTGADQAGHAKRFLHRWPEAKSTQQHTTVLQLNNGRNNINTKTLKGREIIILSKETVVNINITHIFSYCLYKILITLHYVLHLRTN